MLWLNPDLVTLTLDGAGSLALADVLAVAVDRRAERLAIEFTDLGPYAAFVDVPAARVALRVERAVLPGGAPLPTELVPGALCALGFRISPARSDVGGAVVSVARAVVVGVEHSLDFKRGMRQTVSLLALSEDGAIDPISIQDSST